MSQSFRSSFCAACLLSVATVLCLAGTSGALPGPQDSGVSVSVGGGRSQTPQPKSYIKFISKPSSQTARKATEELRSRMRQNVEIDMTGGVPLFVVREQLQKALGSTVLLDTSELALAGLDPETTLVDAACHGMQLGVALRFLLPQIDMGYYIEAGVLILTSTEIAETQLIAEIYDCRDLLQADAALMKSMAPVEAPAELAPGTGVGGESPATANPPSAGLGGGGFIVGETKTADRLIDVVTTVTGQTGHNGWLNDGTGIGTIKVFSGQLVVSQTLEVHDEIEDLLSLLRESIRNSSANDAVGSTAR